MRAAVAQLVLLLCLSGTSADQGFTHNNMITAPESIQTDVWAELKELRDMVVEQRVELSTTKAELQNQKTTVEDLKKVNAVLLYRLDETEHQVQALERETSALKTRLTAVETGNEEQAAEMMSMEARLTSSESRVEALERDNADRPKVAFSAALKTTIGPLPANSLATVVHNNVITNIGKAYSSITGAFTAPVKGIYYFAINGMDDRYDLYLHLILYKNGQYIMSRKQKNNGGDQYVFGALILELEAGDIVDTHISGSHRLVGNDDKPTMFSGFLLFPL